MSINNNPFNITISIGLIVAVGVGLLIGIERERRKGKGKDREAAGIRSFTARAKRCQKLVSKPATWPPLASPINAKPQLSGIAQPIGQFTTPSFGNAAAPQPFAKN